MGRRGERVAKTPCGRVSVGVVAVDTDRIWVATSDRGVRSYSLPIQFRRLVPIVLDVNNGFAHYTTELVVSNPCASAASMTLLYTA